MKDSEIQPYFARRTEIYIQDSCLLWGARVIIPGKLRSKMLGELHKEHVGATRMKQLARSYLWWPGLDKDLENLVNSCDVCLELRPNPKKAPLHPWEYPDKPWSRIHIDYAGPVQNTYFLVVVDAYSKWAEIMKTANPNSTNTIKMLSHIFSRFGLLSTLVSDNGSSFTSYKFMKFVNANSINHIKSSPYKPSTNGLAESMVKSFKNALKFNQNDCFDARIDKFLFKYRITPHSTTGISPSELMLGRTLRTTLDAIKPKVSLETRVHNKAMCQKKYYDGRSVRSFEVKEGEKVMAKNYSGNRKPKWTPATVIKQTGPVSYKLELPDTRIIKRHQDQIQIRGTMPNTPKIINESIVLDDNVASQDDVPTPVVEPDIVLPRRFGRTIKAPDRLNL